MKTKNKITSYILLTVLCLSAFSCKKDFNEVNTDPIGRSTTTAGQLLAPALVNVLSTNMVRNRNFNNELMQVTVDIGDSEGKVFRYDVRRNLADYTWNNWYLELTNLRDIYTIADRPESLNSSYKGISLITQAWVFQLLTDVYGDVPYLEANKGKEGVIEPVFDKQKDIYLDLLNKLEEANKLLAEGTAISASADPVYQGDVSKWRRFGNSLYLRLLLRISGKADVRTQVIAKIKEIADTNKSNYPIMENNTHTAKILWNGTNSSTAVYSSPFMINVRAVDFRTPAITEFFIGNLGFWKDPRITSAYGINGYNRFGIAAGPAGLIGVPSGYDSGTSITKQSYFYSDAQNASITLQTDRYTGIIMNCAEVDFILAEAAAKGWISGTGEAYYTKGIADALNYWLPTLFTSVSDPLLIQYINEADIEWNNALPLDNTATNTPSKMQLIQLQKYYSSFLVDFQQWLEYRRTGHPFLPKGTGLANGGKMPSRLNYPLVTQSTNPTNYKNAVASQGADEINTLVWWQKP
ncbi:SusD/RagB family nutrient-binding outer membrane lipoprotein [Pedobacter petrophilus]|uniref:SusD/RagB family nutrient-binding outer membrane lipoprotein n=1 Tax=Pedobacter petrophilus TaxID=1908241 RepID=A0A7K0FWU7_9SPHI|nr:SusD/RagB family nutrient-binding outer membrane lipoprotein [Pedobacter petrophilus]MRX76048.1 SusD/RagB family nutrient-binding outer membrane lipoprotein [Pedobacter petrophilus]